MASTTTGGARPPPTERLARGAAISSLAVLGSRMMGLLREQVFAFFFGASREYDAFLTAFRIPNLLRDLLAEGALSTAFVTVFVGELQRHGKARAFAVANTVVNALALLLTLLVLAGIACAPSMVAAMAMGFDADKAALTVTLTRIMWPFILLVTLSAVAMGMLNAQERYAVPQSASTFFNVVSLGVGLGTAFALEPEHMRQLWQHAGGPANPAGAARAMVGMAIGTLAGGLCQLGVQCPTLARTGYRWTPRLALADEGFVRVLRLLGPAVVGAAAVQFNVFVNSNFASILGDKPISWLNYAFRLMQFPIGVFGVAVMTAALPAMSRALSAGDRPLFGATLTRSLELVWLLTLPSALGLLIVGEPILRLIYQHGRFGSADTAATYAALAAYAVGLPGYAAIKILQPAFVAMGDAKTPMVSSLLAIACNVALNYLFVLRWHIGHVGLALSTSLMANLNVVLLLVALERRNPSLQRRRLLWEIARIALAAATMGSVCRLGQAALMPAWQRLGLAQDGRRALVELALLLPLAGATYLGTARLLRVAALDAAWAAVRRRRVP